ncbi:hypothetical protein K3G64_03170 [Mycobacterium sp. IDR2000157661]|nr:hypothetical protein [Mycobacterium sp. IDR2000157661]ULE33717.1 hypothetical protein K3G64_03170 [Mycobacterium sp. IDR2000157661]
MMRASVFAIVLLASGGAAAALAQPDFGIADPAPGTTQMGWSQLGLSDRLVLLGYNQAGDVEVPVPQGVTPALVAGQIGSVVNVTTGKVDVLDGRGVALATIPVPADGATEPFLVDTSQAQVTDGRVAFSFVLRGDDGDGSERSCGQSPSVTLTQLAVTFSGDAPNPRVVADFLPGYVDSISIWVGRNPSPSQQQAALNLVAKLTNLYRPIPVRIDVSTAAEPPRPTDTSTSRVMEIREGGPAGLEVANGGTPAARLVISGQGTALTRQIDIFADRRILLAQSQTASVTAVSDLLAGSTEILTFAQLGIGAKASVLGTTILYAGFDASRFAVGSVQEAKVHLIAQYTAVESGTGSVMISSGDAVLASRALDRSGALDLVLELPTGAIASNVGLALEIRYFPDRDCPPTTDRITFALDPRSTISVKPGSADGRSGFAALPMAFTPDFDVAVEQPDQIRYAARAINLIGQQTGYTLRPNVIPIGEATASEEGLLLVAGGEALRQAGLDPPVLPVGGAAATIDGNPFTDLVLGGALGVIQIFSDNGRTVLAISSNGGTELLDRSFDYVSALEGRWASIAGDVVATGANADTVNLTIRTSPPPRRPSAGWRWWTWTTVAVGALAVGATATVLIVRRRRSNVTG